MVSIFTFIIIRHVSGRYQSVSGNSLCVQPSLRQAVHLP